MPAIYVAKYNRFVDNILARMNKILRKSYDPVSVRLQPVEAKKKSTRSKKGKKKNGARRRSEHVRRNNYMRSVEDVVEAQNETKTNDSSPIQDTTIIRISTISMSTATPEEIRKESSTEAISTQTPVNDAIDATTSEAKSTQTTSTTVTTSTTTERIIKTSTTEQTSPIPNGNRASNQAESQNPKKKTKGKNRGKQNKKSKPKARGTLYGLSSLRRNGDVTVNIMADYTTVKTDFLIGPLILKVEKEFGRGAKKELKSATATTAEMLGKINLRIPNGGGATLHSIKVLQPKQVRVDSVDNHDRTREFLWRRSSNIAHVVSQKLTSVTRSLLKK